MKWKPLVKIQGKDGADGSPDTPIQIADKLNTLDGVLNPKIIKGYKSAKDLFSEYASLPETDKQSWTKMFREGSNAFNYYQVSSAGTGSSLSIGSTVGSGTDKSVLFVSGTTLAQDPTNISYDNAALVKTFSANRVSASRALVIPAWTAATVYLANDIVQNGNSLYKRIAGGTSGATFDPTEEAAWTLFGLSTTGTIAPWAPSMYYEVGEVVTNNGTIYRTTTTHTSPATFTLAEQTNFSVIANYTDIDAFTGSTVYPAGKLVAQGNRILKRTAAGTSAATFTNAEAALWSLVTNEIIGTWTAATYYYPGEILTDGNVIFRRINAGISGATLDSAEWFQYLYISQIQIPQFTGNTAYIQGMKVYSPIPQSTLMVLTTNSHTTAATFTSAEALNWNMVSPALYYIPIPTALYRIGDFALNPINQTAIMRNTSDHTYTLWTAGEAANWTLLSNGTPSAWATTTVYLAGQQVTQGTRLLQRIATGTSGATFTNAEAAAWTLITNDTIGSFIATTYYYAGEKIFQGGIIYQRIASGISGATFNAAEAANWTPFTSSGASISAFTGTTYYEAGSFVTQGTRILYRLASGTSAATFTNAEAATWGLVSNEGIPAWAPTTYYYASEQVGYQGGIITSNTSRISGATFDATEGAVWTSVTAGIAAWTASTYYYANTQVTGTYSDRIIRRSSSGLSGATFNLAEAGQYAVVKEVVTQVFTGSTVYYRGEQVTDVVNGNNVYARKSSGLAGATLDATELLNWTLVAGAPYTSIPAATPYTVVETDDMIDLPAGATFIITIPASRINPIIKFSTASLSATQPTIATAGGETITNPSTFASVTSFPMPGVPGLGSSVQFQKVGTTWRFIA